MSGLLSPDTGYFGYFLSFRFGGRQPACTSKRKNSSKISLWRVRAVFTERIFVITTKKPQWILDVFTRLLRKLGQKYARQNRWEFEYHQPWARFAHSEHFFQSQIMDIINARSAAMWKTENTKPPSVRSRYKPDWSGRRAVFNVYWIQKTRVRFIFKTVS